MTKVALTGRIGHAVQLTYHELNKPPLSTASAAIRRTIKAEGEKFWRRHRFNPANEDPRPNRHVDHDHCPSNLSDAELAYLAEARDGHVYQTAIDRRTEQRSGPEHPDPDLVWAFTAMHIEPIRVEEADTPSDPLDWDKWVEEVPQETEDIPMEAETRGPNRGKRKYDEAEKAEPKFHLKLGNTGSFWTWTEVNRAIAATDTPGDTKPVWTKEELLKAIEEARADGEFGMESYDPDEAPSEENGGEAPADNQN